MKLEIKIDILVAALNGSFDGEDFKILVYHARQLKRNGDQDYKSLLSVTKQIYLRKQRGDQR